MKTPFQKAGLFYLGYLGSVTSYPMLSFYDLLPEMLNEINLQTKTFRLARIKTRLVALQSLSSPSF